MVRILIIVSAVALAAAFSVSNVAAQKKSPQCVANFHDACMKRCLNGGGQPRLCPQFCQKRERELGC